jgi:hypothetical protein
MVLVALGGIIYLETNEQHSVVDSLHISTKTACNEERLDSEDNSRDIEKYGHWSRWMMVEENNAHEMRSHGRKRREEATRSRTRVSGEIKLPLKERQTLWSSIRLEVRV